MLSYDITEENEDLPAPEELSPDISGKKPSFIRSQLLIITQLILCALVLAFAFIAKAVGGDLYAGAASWYFDSYNASLFTGSTKPDSPFTDDAKVTETSLTSPEVTSSSSVSCMPLKSAELTFGFGSRERNGRTENHKGIDLVTDKDSEIYAVLDGEVVTAENDPSYGNYVILKHSTGTQTLYAHCDSLSVKKGDKVKAGSVIALVGSTGDSDVPHLHFEVIKNGTNIDPISLIGDYYK